MVARKMLRNAQDGSRPASRLPTFARSALGKIDWSTWYGDANYRFFVDLQVFGGGMQQYAGRPPTLQALTAGLDAVHGFVLSQAQWPPPIAIDQSKHQVALEAALEVAAALYDLPSVEAALGALRPRWARAAGGSGAGAQLRTQ